MSLFLAFTRISEYKHSPNQPEGAHDLPGTVIYKVSDTAPLYEVFPATSTIILSLVLSVRQSKTKL